ncbi:IclR family transcriptional regulator [Verrucomicrobiota bacterium]
MKDLVMGKNMNLIRGESRYKVPNLERALIIMEHLINYPDGLRLIELTKALGFSKNSVFRITTTLLDKGYLKRDEDTKCFSLSRKMLAMGHIALHEKPIVPLAIDIMRECRDILKETVLIGTIVETECVVLEQVLGSHPFKFSVDIGARLMLHVAAPGKALLANLPDNEQTNLINRIKLIRFNEKTITTKKALRTELQHIRKTGLAFDRGEQLHGIHCIAAPIFNQHGCPVAAIWTTGPADRLTESLFRKIGKVIQTHANKISRRLGHNTLKN